MTLFWRSGLTLTLIAVPIVAMAQGAAVAAVERTAAEPVAGPGAEADAGVQEVVVTAQKRAENLQSVPLSVSALTANQLAETKMGTPSALATQIPNLQVGGVNGEGSPIFSLRGVSMFDYSLNQSSPVASYIDEVYKGNVVLFGVEMYDLDRVEVLRGPQGTLYGKNFRTLDGTVTGTPLRNDQVAQNYTPHRQQDNEAAELTLDWALNRSFALKSICC